MSSSNSIASSAPQNSQNVAGIGAAASLISRRTFDPNRPTSLYLPINYDQELGNFISNDCFILTFRKNQIIFK